MRKMNLPEYLEIGEIPESWKIVRFGQIATFTKKPRNLRYSEYNEVPFIPMDLIPIAKLFSDKFILKTNDELSSGTYFEPGDILLSKITPSFENGKQCIIKELPTPFGIATTEVIPIREVRGVSHKSYLFYYLLLPNVRVLLAGKMQGSTGRQRLNKSALINLQIPLPPLPEQRAIAHVLQTIQDAKATRQREIALAREHKAALMDYLFSHGTTGEPRKQTEIGQIPESWEILPFEACLKKLKPKKVSSIPKKDYQTAGDFPVIDQGASFISGWTNSVECIIFENLPVIIFGDHTRIFKYVDFPFAIGADGTKRLYANDDFLDARFFYYALVNLKVPNKGYNRHYRYLREFSVPYPPLSEQRAIAQVFQAMDEKIAALEQEVVYLDELFYAMLDELMTGQRTAVPLIDARIV